MTPVDDDMRTALELLEPKIAEFEARAARTAALCPPGDPLLQNLRQHLDLLLQERHRLQDQLKAHC